MTLSIFTRQLGVLGSGEFGTVCKGKWVFAGKKLDVAIKILSDSSEASKVKFLQEAATMSQFKHPNVIKLYGVVTDGPQVCLNSDCVEVTTQMHLDDADSGAARKRRSSSST